MGLNANITVHGWRKPTLALELVEGGSLLPNTKYYVIGIMGFTPRVYCANGSPPSDAYDITTTTTALSIKITQKTYRDITVFADNGDSRTLITSARHCLADSVIGYSLEPDTIKIASGSYAGTWTVDEWVSYDQFIIDTPYVDNVPVQCYTDSIRYNRPKNNYSAYYLAQGMAYYVGTINPYVTDHYWQYDYWTRRAHITGHPNPITITAQPTEKFGDQCVIPQTGRYNKGVYKCLEPYGIPTIEILGATTPSAILSEVQSSGFIYNFGYEANTGYTLKPQMDCFSSIRCFDTGGFTLTGASITFISEVFHAYDATKLVFDNCGINFPLTLSSAYWFFTAANSVVYNNATTTAFQGWVHGDNVIFYASPRISSIWGDGFDTYIDEESEEEMSYSIVINKEFRECSPQTTLQNPYNQVQFQGCETYPFYWILRGSYYPPIYMLENVIINWSGSYEWHFRFFNYNNTGYPSVLKFLNVNCPENSDNHKDIIHNSTLNLTCLFYRRIEFYVQDNEGVELSGAKVTITDDASNEYTDTTDVNGYVYLDILEQKDVIVDTEPIYTPPTVTIYTNFVIEVSKDGYNDYTATFDNMYTNEKQSIAMVEPVYYQKLIAGTVSAAEVSGQVSQSQVKGTVKVETNIGGNTAEKEVSGSVETMEISGTKNN